MDSARQKPLRAALVGNSAFSGLFGLALLLFPDEFLSFAGLSSTFRPTILAVSLLVYAAWLLSNALRREVKIGDARIAVVLDVAWVGLTIPFALFFPLTNEGRGLVVAVGGVVSLFAWLQWRGIRIIRRNAMQASHA
jgi:hypothetical protein